MESEQLKQKKLEKEKENQKRNADSNINKTSQSNNFSKTDEQLIEETINTSSDYINGLISLSKYFEVSREKEFINKIINLFKQKYPNFTASLNKKINKLDNIDKESSHLNEIREIPFQILFYCKYNFDKEEKDDLTDTIRFFLDCNFTPKMILICQKISGRSNYALKRLINDIKVDKIKSEKRNLNSDNLLGSIKFNTESKKNKKEFSVQEFKSNSKKQEKK